MKLKLLALTSLSLVALSFTACGGDNKTEEKASVQTETPAPAKEVKAETPAPAQKVEEAPVKTETPEPAPKTEEATVSAPVAVDGATIFHKCQSCHGAKAEKSALGKSKVIADFSKEELVNAINGYKNGTYGGSMKALMKGQVGPLNDAEVEAVADYISNLK